MPVYLVSLRMPKNPRRVIHLFRERMINLCLQENEDCVLDYVSGRFVLFASQKICDSASMMDEVLRCEAVEVYENIESLVRRIAPLVKKCETFAVRSNHLHVAQEIGGIIFDTTGTKVNLENPECEVRVEYRGGFYFLIV